MTLFYPNALNDSNNTHTFGNNRRECEDDPKQLKNSARMMKVREARRLTRLYGINVKSVATSDVRFKPRKRKPAEEVHCSLSQDTARTGTVAKALSNFLKPVKKSNEKEVRQEKVPSSMEILAEPKSRVLKFDRRPRDEADLTEMHADNYNIEQPWLVGYRNSPELPAGSPFAIASR